MPATAPLVDAVLSKGGVKAMGVYAYDPSTYPFIAKWGKQKLPVVSWHFPVPEGTAPGLTATTGCSPDRLRPAAPRWRSARRSAARARSRSPRAASTRWRTSSPRRSPTTMKAKYPNVKVLKPQVEGFDAPAAKAKAVSILQSDPDDQRGVLDHRRRPRDVGRRAAAPGRRLTIIGMDYVRRTSTSSRAARSTPSSASRCSRRAPRPPTCWRSWRRASRSPTRTRCPPRSSPRTSSRSTKPARPGGRGREELADPSP